MARSTLWKIHSHRYIVDGYASEKLAFCGRQARHTRWPYKHVNGIELSGV
jgi:hypothetical protein